MSDAHVDFLFRILATDSTGFTGIGIMEALRLVTVLGHSGTSAEGAKDDREGFPPECMASTLSGEVSKTRVFIC